METIIPLLHKLGLVRAVWLHAKDGSKRITYLRQSPYNIWVYENSSQQGWTIVLNEDGTIRTPVSQFTHWTFYTEENHDNI